GCNARNGVAPLEAPVGWPCS
ncbi:hypothetical protein AZZ95_002714, partial [Enterobacter roggenkampii]